MHRRLADLLPARVRDRHVVRIGGRREGVFRVVVGADHGLPLHRFAWSVDRAIGVEMTDEAPHAVTREAELVRVQARPVRAHHRVAPPAVDPEDRAPIDVRAGRDRRELEHRDAVRVGHRLARGVRAGLADGHARERRAAVVVERPHEDVGRIRLRHEDGVHDGEHELGLVLPARPQEVVALPERAAAAERGRSEHDVVLRTANRLAPRAKRGQARVVFRICEREVVHETPAFVRGERPERELDRRQVRRLVVEDRLGRGRVERLRAVARERERNGGGGLGGGERERIAAQDLAVPIGGAR